MRWRKIPPDAFLFYRSLGPERSYQAVARHYGVSKRALTTRAVKERWQERLREGEEGQSECIQEMNERHLRIARFLKEKALEVLRQFPLEDLLAAVSKLDSQRSRRSW